MATVYERMKAEGVETDHHESDLYVPVNATTRKVLEAYEYRENVTVFASQIDGKLWYDIPFAYDPAWAARPKA
jgi:hypothetical protein